MKTALKNTYKSKITSLVGVIIYILTTYLLYKGTITMFPDAFVGYSIGTVLLLSPDTIVTLIKKYIGGSNDNIQTPN